MAWISLDVLIRNNFHYGSEWSNFRIRFPRSEDNAPTEVEKCIWEHFPGLPRMNFGTKNRIRHLRGKRGRNSSQEIYIKQNTLILDPPNVILDVRYVFQYS